MKINLLKVLVVAALSLCASFSFAREYYVDVNGSDAPATLSTNWTTAFKSLTNAFRWATSNSTIYLRGGQTHFTSNQIVWRTNDLTLLGGYEGTNETGSGNFDETLWPSLIVYTNAQTNRVFWMVGATNPTLGRVTVMGGRLTNTITSFGAGMYIESCTNATVFSTKFLTNIGNAYGAGMAISNSFVTISNCVLQNNVLTNPAVNFGSGLLVMRGIVNVYDSTVNNNTNGGGIYFENSTNSLLSGCTISSNRANNMGGGVFLTNSVVTISNCFIRANSVTNLAARYGGGLYVGGAANGSAVRVFDTFIDGNDGGGVWMNSSTNSMFVRCSISSNSVAQYGGGMYVTNSTVTISNCVINANILTNGAVLRAGGGLYVYGQPVQVFNTLINGNDGGGVFLASSTNSILSGCTINSNMAPQYGAGLFLTNVYLTVTNCEFRANTLTNTLGATYGAGVYQTNGETLYVNTLFDNNRSLAVSPQGNAVYLAVGTNRFLKCTSARHNVEGIRQQQFAGSMVEIRNSILWDNGDSLVGVDPENLYYSNIREGDNAGINGCISTDPFFADYFTGDFHLKSQQGRWASGVWAEDIVNSPCIDAGDMSPPYAAFENETQPNGSRVNMGCYGNTPQASRTLSPPRMVITPGTYTHYAMHTQDATNRYFTISNTNSYGRKIFYTTATDYGWFSSSPESGEIASDSVVTITNLFNTSVLGVGSYTGRVTVLGTDSTGNSAADSPATVTVTLNVSPEPTLMLSATNMSRITMQGTDAAAQGFEVWNAADPGYLIFGMRFFITSSVPWLHCSPATGVSYGNHVTVTNIYNTAVLLAAGTHTATLTVYATAADYPDYVVTNAPQQIVVTVTVNAKPGLARTPAVVTNFTTMGFNAPSKNISVWNNSPHPRVPMNYTVTKDVNWMTVDPGNGSSTGEVDDISVRFDTLYMLSGLYTGRVIFVASGDSTNTPLDTVVNLVVNSLPECNVDAYTLVNYGSEGHDAPSQTFHLWNSSDWPKGLLSYVVTDDVPWLQVTPSSGVNYGDPSTLTVKYDTDTMAQGTYHGIITIHSEDASTGAGDMTRQIAVALLVSGKPVLVASASRVENSVIQNAIAPQKTFSIWNGVSAPRGPMSYVITPSVAWLSTSPSSGTTTGNVSDITLNFNSVSLPAGTVTGNLAIVAWDTLTGDAADGSPFTLPVVLSVDPRTPANHEIPTISGLPYVRQTLTAQKGYWTPTNQMSFTYQWQTADDLSGTGTLDIPGATASTYVVQPQDAGKFIRIRVTGRQQSYTPPLVSSAYSVFSHASRIKAARADFDGDGKADPWFYYPPTGTWRMLYSRSSLPTAFDFGWAQTAPLPGDYDGDGQLDIAVYYQAEGLWYIWTANSYYSKACGWWAAIPVPGDYDGDGATDLAVYHPDQGVWYVLTYTGWFFAQSWGWNEAYPYPADYNGDGITDLAIYHQSAGDWYIITLTGELLAWKLNFGWFASTPAPADYDGDGKDDLAVYYQAGNIWYLLLSKSGKVALASFGTSVGNGIPVPGDYDGDGRCDPATVHAYGDTLIWCIQQSRDGYIGHSYNLTTGQWR